MFAVAIQQHRAEWNRLAVGIVQFKLDASAFAAFEACKNHRTSSWHQLLGGIVQLDLTAQVTRVQRYPVDAVRLRVRQNRIAVQAGFHTRIAADFDARHAGDFHQAERFTDGLAQIDAAGMSHDRSGRTQVLRLIAAASAVAKAHIAHRRTGTQTERARALALDAAPGLHGIVGVAVLGQITIDPGLRAGTGVLMVTGNVGTRCAWCRSERERY